MKEKALVVVVGALPNRLGCVLPRAPGVAPAAGAAPKPLNTGAGVLAAGVEKLNISVTLRRPLDTPSS